MTDCRKSGFPWFVMVAVAYCLGYGWFLWSSDFLPYVIDNNETFSSLVHAANLYHFGIEKTFGLTDEAYGMSEAAHPYVYTHQGNFPRLYALLLYALGARSPESQIVITTFTIGFSGIYFAFRFMSVLFSKPFAAVFCLVMMSDYLMFAQWQVNTWQVWHLFFFFSSLLCINGLGAGRSRIWIPLSLLNFSCLLYYEILFSVFVLTFCGLYAIYFHGNRLRNAFSTMLVIGAGAGLGATVLVAQNIAYFGVEKFLQDLKLTYMGRNMAGSSRELIQKLAEFYDQNNIVFWHNITEASYLRSPIEMAWHFSNFVMAPYTPYLVLSVLAILLSLMVVSINRWNIFSARGKIENPDRTGGPGSVFLAAAFATFAGSVLIDSRFAGLSFENTSALQIVVRSLLFAGALAMAIYGFSRLLRAERGLRVGNITGTVFYLLMISALIRTQPFWYDPIHEALWQEAAGFFGSGIVLQIFIMIMVWVGARNVLTSESDANVVAHSVAINKIFMFILFGIIAFSLSAVLIPGYLKTVYLARYAPLTVFFHVAPIALSLFMLGSYVVQSSVLSRGLDERRVGTFRARGFLAAVSMCFMIFYWCQLQATYVSRLPPDHFSFVKELRSPPFTNASFAVNTYAAPIAVSTGHWAYFDPVLGNGLVETTEQGPLMIKDLKLLWFADKRSNPDYRNPDYFLCIRSQYFHGAGVSGPYGHGNPPPDGCSLLPLVANSSNTVTSGIGSQIVRFDPSGRDRWAIVRLDQGLWHQGPDPR